MNPFEVEMNKAFRKLAEDIIPNDELLKKMKVCADNVGHIVFFRFFAINTAHLMK